MGFVIRATHGIVLLPVLVAYVIIVLVLKKKGSTSVYIFLFSIFYIYLYALASFTLFPIHFGEAFTGVTDFNIRYNIRLIPLITLTQADIRTSVLNVLLTIPFGFGISFVAKVGNKKIIFLGFSLGFLIEALQLLQGLVAGFTFRIIDIDDVIFNFIGVLIGYAAFWIFKKLYDEAFNRFSKRPDSKCNAMLLYVRNLAVE